MKLIYMAQFISIEDFLIQRRLELQRALSLFYVISIEWANSKKYEAKQLFISHKWIDRISNFTHFKLSTAEIIFDI